MAKRKQSQREIILNHFKSGDQNALSLSLQQDVNFPIATVHKRINDLWNDGLIDQTGFYIETQQGQTYAMYYRVPESKREQVIKNRNNQLNLEWLAQGKRKGYITSMVYDQMLYDLTEEINKQ